MSRDNNTNFYIFFWRHGLLLWTSLICYIGNLFLDIFVCCSPAISSVLNTVIVVNNYSEVLKLIIPVTIICSNVYMGCQSMEWYLKKPFSSSSSTSSLARTYLLRVVFYPIAPILRYFDTWWCSYKTAAAAAAAELDDEDDVFIDYLFQSAEVSILRLINVFTGDGIIIIFEIFFIFKLRALEEQQDTMMILLISITMIVIVVTKLALSMSLSLVHYITCEKMLTRASPLTIKAQCTLFCWHFFCLMSQVTAYGLFLANNNNNNINKLVFIMFRWIIHFLWIYFCENNDKKLTPFIFASVNMFTYVTIFDGKRVGPISFYYLISLLHNVGIVVSSFFIDKDTVSGVIIIFGGFLLGISFMMSYYCVDHPNAQNVWGWRRLRHHHHHHHHQIINTTTTTTTNTNTSTV